MSAYTTLSETVVADTHDVWILDSIARNRGRPHIHLLPVLFYQTNIPVPSCGTGRVKGLSFRGQEDPETKPRVLTCTQSRRAAAAPVVAEPAAARVPPAVAEIEVPHEQDAARVAVDGPPEEDRLALPHLGNEVGIG